MVVEAKRSATPKSGPRASPVSKISNIASLKRFPDKDYALDLLHQIARAVAPIIHQFDFRVGTLCEMYPKSPNLLGLNVNKGQKILIRLRQPSNERAFYPMGDLIGTFLHELVHNVHGPHDAKFYALLDQLKDKYEHGVFSASDYVCEENRLGSAYVPPWSTPRSIRQKRLEALSKGKYMAEARRVGGSLPAPRDVRKAMLEAAEKRLRDSKWCSQTGHVDQVDNEELEVQELPNSEFGASHVSEGSRESYKDVIDLTQDDIGDEDPVEIIDVDACELPSSEDKRDPLSGASDELGFSVEPSTISLCSTVQYYISSSPRTFIGDDVKYPRRKLVADVNFKQIIESATVVNIDSCSRRVGARGKQGEKLSTNKGGRRRAKRLGEKKEQKYKIANKSTDVTEEVDSGEDEDSSSKDDKRRKRIAEEKVEDATNRTDGSNQRTKTRRRKEPPPHKDKSGEPIPPKQKTSTRTVQKKMKHVRSVSFSELF